MHPRIARCAVSEAVRKAALHVVACGRDIGPAGEPKANRADVFAYLTQSGAQGTGDSIDTAPP